MDKCNFIYSICLGAILASGFYSANINKSNHDKLDTLIEMVSKESPQVAFMSTVEVGAPQIIHGEEALWSEWKDSIRHFECTCGEKILFGSSYGNTEEAKAKGWFPFLGITNCVMGENPYFYNWKCPKCYRESVYQFVDKYVLDGYIILKQPNSTKEIILGQQEAK